MHSTTHYSHLSGITTRKVHFRNGLTNITNTKKNRLPPSRLETALAGVGPFALGSRLGTYTAQKLLLFRVVVGQMPAAAVFAPIHPQLGIALDEGLSGGALGLGLIVVDDLARAGATFRGEVVHAPTLAMRDYSRLTGFLQ